MTTANPKETKAKNEAPASVNRPTGNKPNIEVRVGIFTFTAMLLFMYGQSWLKQISFLNPPQKIQVQFHDVAGLANNAPVNINGVRVGTVEKIQLVSKGRVLAHLKIKTEEATVPQGSTFTIQTLGMVGAKYIEITLPEEKPGDEPRPPIDENTVVVGDDPVRVELVINKIATNLNRMIGRISDEATQSGLADALQHSGETIKNINEAANKLNKNMDKINDATLSLRATSDKFGNVATSADGFFKAGRSTLIGYSDLSKDLRKTSGRVNVLLDDPQMGSNIKSTLESVRTTADTIRATMKDLNVTLQDKDLRTDILSVLDRVNKSTLDISNSMKEVSKMSGDTQLRSDIKDIVQNAKEAVTKVDNIISEPEFKTDLRKTIRKVEDAATNVDISAQQLHQILGKRAPLLHVMFGRPGKTEKTTIKKETKDGDKTEKSTVKVETKTTTENEAPASDNK